MYPTGWISPLCWSWYCKNNHREGDQTAGSIVSGNDRGPVFGHLFPTIKFMVTGPVRLVKSSAYDLFNRIKEI